MASPRTVRGSALFALNHLAGWSPFRLDAFGLVTPIGAEEVATAIGGLQRNWITEYLPLLGSFLVAEDKITAPLPGFKLYNASHGIYVPVGVIAAEVLAVTIGIVANSGLITVAALQGDSYGIANAADIAVSALTRRLMMSKKRRSLNKLVENMQDKTQLEQEALSRDSVPGMPQPSFCKSASHSTVGSQRRNMRRRVYMASCKVQRRLDQLE
ncbi:hypothetical protein N658DRAFT_557108 [Parathielavia hyrcaniae]|uniref:Uncharacterized protein n=1 Tax=Parathielavia hyrcaniae TaxID=113614 RepID=A0AAN6T467_9PEZI|nr:hypothetical protein N658DRAFT_557108 [Parathielavia hyrcaniae]